MTAAGPPSDGAEGSIAAPERPYLARFRALAGGYWKGDGRWAALALTAGLVLLTMGQVGTMIATSYWNANLFNALERRDADEFIRQLMVFGGLLALNLSITVVHLHLKRRLQFGWRQWLTRRLLDDWVLAGNAYELSYLSPQIDNPDGRIAEDIRAATETAIDLGHSLFYCVLLFFSFVGILWTISGELTLMIAGHPVALPGHMVWLAFLYATVGSTFTIWIGRPLVRATKMRQAVEGNFRFGLVRLREHALAIAVMRGDDAERSRLIRLAAGIADAWHRQTDGIGRNLMFSSGYGMLAGVLPILVSAPRYMGGSITLGTLMQIAQAFQQLTGALSWPVDNISRRAEWRASVERVLDLADALQNLKSGLAQIRTARIKTVHGQGPALAFTNLWIANPDGDVILRDFTASVAPGDRVLISGDPAAALKLFKVVAGMWPWGRGTITLPGDTDIFFVPQRSYIPEGTLADALRYPLPDDRFFVREMKDALEGAGLSKLVARLYDHADWEDVLTAGEQQRLGFARLLLHRPRFIFLQEATDALDASGADDMMALLIRELPDSALITIGFHSALIPFHRRVLELERCGDQLVRLHEHDPNEAPAAPGEPPCPPQAGNVFLPLGED